MVWGNLIVDIRGIGMDSSNDAIIAKLRTRCKDQIGPRVRALHTYLTTQALDALARGTMKQHLCVEMGDSEKVLLTFLDRYPTETRAEFKEVFQGFRLLTGYMPIGHCEKMFWALYWDPMDTAPPVGMKVENMVVDFPLA